MKALTSADFDKEVLQAKEPVVIDFWAEWCGPCKMLTPVMEQISESKKGIKFYKMNTDDCGDIAGNMRIMSIPCLIFMNKGKEVDRMVGFNQKEKIIDWLDQCSK
jgi:thioredoxin 1